MKYLVFVAAIVGVTATTTCAAEYRLPFDGRWFVMAGGDTINVNHHMVERSQWFGVDFMKTGGPADRAVAKGDGKSLDDYYSWGEPVLSPVDGVVRRIQDGEPDNPIGTADKNNAFANYVAVEASPTEFVYLGHMQKASIVVREGERVTAGQLLGSAAIQETQQACTSTCTSKIS